MAGIMDKKRIKSKPFCFGKLPFLKDNRIYPEVKSNSLKNPIFLE
jgi:hypothetical protein